MCVKVAFSESHSQWDIRRNLNSQLGTWSCFRRIPCGKKILSEYSLRKSPHQNTVSRTHLFLQRISQSLINELWEEIVQPAETRSDHRNKGEYSAHIITSKTVKKSHCIPSYGFPLPGSTVEFDCGAAYSGCAVGVADLRSACIITLDGNAWSDGELVHIQIKEAAVLSVKREESLQQECHKMLYNEEVLSHLHNSEVLDPPVSMQTDYGITNGQCDTSSRG